MKKTFTLFCNLVLGIVIIAQPADFENFNLNSGQFLNGSDGSGGFQSGSFFFPNEYNDIYMSWSGFAVSSMTDTTTPGLPNQFSCIAGEGAANSTTYGLAFSSQELILKMPLHDDPWTFPDKMMITNSTWAYLSMQDGDNFAKKFGGPDGNDPDFFMLTIKGYVKGQLIEDSIDFYLADYRFDDNSLDYIVDEWTEINLMQLGHVDSLSFQLSSSDTSQWGINTPGYFAFDNLQLGIIESATEELKNVAVGIFPNPTVDELFIDWNENLDAEVFIYSSSGQLIKNVPLAIGRQNFDVHDFPSGIYILKIQTAEGWVSRRFVKN